MSTTRNDLTGSLQEAQHKTTSMRETSRFVKPDDVDLESSDNIAHHNNNHVADEKPKATVVLNDDNFPSLSSKGKQKKYVNK
jgi:hypothetical protein